MGALPRAGRQKDQSLSSFSTAMKASVGTWTVPRFRIFFLPVIGSLILSQVSFISFHASRRTAAGALPRAERQKDQSLSSFSTAMKASVGTWTVPKFRIFFLPSFCFSSSFFLRVISPP